MADQSEILANFMEMTKASETEAKFFLEMSQWDLDTAVTQYFDNNTQQQQEAPASTSAPAFEPQVASPPPQQAPKRKAPASKIRTLSDFGNNDDGSDDEHENFFAGGEKSGMIVQGPNKRGGNGEGDNDLVDEILKKAAEGGAGGSSSDGERVKKEKKPTYYTGSGYRLGSEDEPSTLAEPSHSSSAARQAEEEEDDEDEPEPVTRHLTFWRTGFSVDDGPLYEYNDPANQAMLNAINSGRAPLSLLNVSHGQPVEVRVVKRQDEDYTPPPKAPPKPFEGSGHRLGSPSPFTAPPTNAPGAFPATSSNGVAPTLDQTQPVTSIQVRLGDGSRLVAKLNHTHTINDLRQYIEANNPTQRNYILQTTFPVKELSDNNQTIKDAGLLNSVVVQRFQ
ncbi:SEP-domain-containing protein [Backusella circina FSU 941]|nr:SEP-domain-containing protein [Backusella circina FSU 941]